jgi:GST-like protein
METPIDAGAFSMGDDLSAPDVYVTVISRSEPGRRYFYEIPPRMRDIVRRVDANANAWLASLSARRLAFKPGWEG